MHKGDNGRSAWPWLSTTSFLSRQISTEENLPAFLWRRKKYLSGLQWDRDDGGIEAWQQSPASAITAYELSVYFSFLPPFLGLFFLYRLYFLPTPWLWHLVQLHCKGIQNLSTCHARSMAMTAGHDQMCSGSDRRYQQALHPQTFSWFTGCHSQQIQAPGFPVTGLSKADRGPTNFHPDDSLICETKNGIHPSTLPVP